MSRQSFTEGNWRQDPWFRDLCKALVSCGSVTEMANFLRDVGTLSELKAWSERFEVAKQIAAGRTYRDITKSTGASTTTVTRVARFLQGPEGGYRRVFSDRVHAHHSHPRAQRGERMASKK